MRHRSRFSFIAGVAVGALVVAAMALGCGGAGGEAAEMARSTRDRVDVLALASQYAWGVDTLDRELLARTFAADATAEYVAVGPNPMDLDERLEGFDAIYGWLHENLAHRKGTAGLPMHFVSNALVSLDGDAAALRYYMHNRASSVGGVYYVEAIRTQAGWRIAQLRLEEQTWNAAAYANDPKAQRFLKGSAAASPAR